MHKTVLDHLITRNKLVCFFQSDEPEWDIKIHCVNCLQIIINEKWWCMYLKFKTQKSRVMYIFFKHEYDECGISEGH